MNPMSANKGIFLGRMCPVHKGHERIINEMVADVGEKNCLIIIGSANVISDRVPFSYNKRKEWINKLFPRLKVTYLHDQNDDKRWTINLIQVIHEVFSNDFDLNFYSGSLDDVSFLRGIYNVKLIDRSSYNISGTDVRKNLEEYGTTFKLVSDTIKMDVINEWKRYKNGQCNII